MRDSTQEKTSGHTDIKTDSPLAVIKYGGHSMDSVEKNVAFAQNLVRAKSQGWRLFIGHGGGPQINALLDKLAIQSSFKNGLRITTQEAMKAVEMALSGDVNPWLVSILCEQGLQAVGLSGKDCATLTAVKNSDTELGFVGAVTKVNTQLSETLIEAGYTPVLAPIGFGPEGISLNINADTATGSLAGALQADVFLLVTDVAGVLDKEKKRFNHLTKKQIELLIQDETINGGMIPKVQSCLHALSEGCKATMIFDGSTIENLADILSILHQALQTNDYSKLTSGTIITA